MNRALCTSILAGSLTIGSLACPALAQPATQPAAVALDKPRNLADLDKAANAAYDASDYVNALPLLKDLSVRLRNSPEKVAPLLEKIRVCEANVAASQPQLVEGINAPRIAHVKPKDGDTYELALQKLGNFNYDAERGGNIPDDVKALTGSTVKLTGFMIPIDESDKISKFVLVPSLFACCFGQPPSLQHTAIITCPAGKAVAYYPEEITVTGQLKVEEKREEGFVVSLFEVGATSIRPLAK